MSVNEAGQQRPVVEVDDLASWRDWGLSLASYLMNPLALKYYLGVVQRGTPCPVD